jgi:Domain of unknown function (DUF222)/HNH endonuclease
MPSTSPHQAPVPAPSPPTRGASQAPALQVPPGKVVATGLDLIMDRLDEAAAAEAEANRAQARSRAALAEVLRLARANPHLYLRPAGLAQKDVLNLAEDAAAFDAGLRLHLSAGQVRYRAREAQTLHDRLPELNAVFAAGATTLAHVTAASDLITGWTDDTSVETFDTQLAHAAATLTPAQFRARARRLKDKLLTEPAETRHARAFTDRRVVVEPDDDGMAWLHILLSAPDALRISARLNATARAEQKKTPHSQPGWRTRDQHRADLAAAWLAGDGTPTAARVRPVLLVPLLSLIGPGTEPIELRGYGTIDRATAADLFTQAPSFRRVGTDPFTGEKLIYDRHRYKPTTAQRDWIAMRFDNCIDPTCTRPVDDTDIDHLEEWVRDHGATNTDNLFPLCDTSNRRKNLSRHDYQRHPDGTITITTPTGHTTTTEPPPF